MNGEEIFGALVRAIGLCSFLAAALYSYGIMWPDEKYGSASYVACTVFWLMVGTVLFFGADFIVEVAY